MQILITGAKGQLGTDLVLALDSPHVVYPFDLDLDITDAKAVLAKAREIGPDIVLHCAAMTDVDGCETDPETAFKVNSIGTQNVALACRETDAAMLYVSTDFVFDGRKTEPYTEFDEPAPLSVYGGSKLAGERFVRDLVQKHYVVRTAWLYGLTGHNFVQTVLRLADERDRLTIVDDQVGSPTYSRDLAERIVMLIETGWYGTYHATNSGQCSWLDFARTILELAGRDDVTADPISTAELARPATRPAYSVLRSYCLELRGIDPMRPWDEALRDYFASRR